MEIESFNNNSDNALANENPVIIEVITENFMAEVIERSKETPVIVDFWESMLLFCGKSGPVKSDNRGSSYQAPRGGKTSYCSKINQA